jgi:hypothetical protein
MRGHGPTTSSARARGPVRKSFKIVRGEKICAGLILKIETENNFLVIVATSSTLRKLQAELRCVWGSSPRVSKG